MSKEMRELIDKVKSINQFINETYTNTSVVIGNTYSESDVYSCIQKIHRNEDDFYDGDIGERIERFPTYKVVEVPIDKINTDEYELDDADVEDLIEKFKNIGTYPLYLASLEKARTQEEEPASIGYRSGSCLLLE